jgi:mannose-6-phosphate isomerase-like protein (cupin superfamily)
MTEQWLDIKTYAEIGYKPLIDFNCWRVAYLNYIDELDPEYINRLEKHLETDEVFVLLKGEGVLFIGAGNETHPEISPHKMEPCKLYNVKKGAWHNIILSKDATILLVENKDTSEGNSSYYQLTDSQRKFIKEVANKEMPGCDS